MSAALRYAPANSADGAILSAFARDSFCETFGHLYPAADLRAFLEENYSPAIQTAEIADPDTEHRIAWRGAAISGFVKLGRERTGHALPGRFALELHRLYVTRADQGAGVARTLMDWAMARARVRGAVDMTLSVFSENHRAKRFYARYGFIEIAPYVFKVGSIEDADLICRAALDA